MKFSIVIPAYNAEKTLGACLESVQKQTFSDFEAIIVNDGSIDKTHLVAAPFLQTDSRFRYICQENQGVSAARNRAIKEARGEFIVFLDSDDRYDRDYLQEFNGMILAHPNYDHFWCGFRSITPCGMDIGSTVWSDDNGRYYIHDRSQIMDVHEKTLDAALWNKAYRREILKAHEIYMDEAVSLGEDLLFNFAYLDVSRPQIVINNSPMYLYTKAENGTLDSKYRPDLKETYEAINNQLLLYLQRWGVSSTQMTKFYNSVFFAWERVLYNTYRPESTMTSMQKRRFNRQILKSSYFRDNFRKTNCYIHPLYRRAYEMGSWDLVRLLDSLITMKKRFMKK